MLLLQGPPTLDVQNTLQTVTASTDTADDPSHLSDTHNLERLPLQPLASKTSRKKSDTI